MSDKMKNLVKRIRYYDSQKVDKVQAAGALRIVEGQHMFGDEAIQITPTAQRQLLSLAKIPTDFFLNKLAPEEQESVFNRLFHNELQSREFMFRFSADTLYGIVSPRYAKLDNILIVDLLRAAMKSGLKLSPVESELNPDHTRIRLTMRNGALTLGELVPQLTITNSEVGLGSLQVFSGVYRVQCSNGLMIPLGQETRSRWIHSGLDPKIDLDMQHVLALSNEYVHRLEAAQSIYLSAEDKTVLLLRIFGALGQKAALKVCEVANARYEGAPTLFHAINAVTEAAQSFPASERTQIETYASTLLAA